MISLLFEVNVVVIFVEWYGLIVCCDFFGLLCLLYFDVVFCLLMVYKLYVGVLVVLMILNIVFMVFEDFVYYCQLVSVDGCSVVLEFSVWVGECELKGIDMICFDDDGWIVDFEVMVCFMSGFQVFGEEMGWCLVFYLVVSKV